jgi:hypothetical protein
MALNKLFLKQSFCNTLSHTMSQCNTVWEKTSNIVLTQIIKKNLKDFWPKKSDKYSGQKWVGTITMWQWHTILRNSDKLQNNYDNFWQHSGKFAQILAECCHKASFWQRHMPAMLKAMFWQQCMLKTNFRPRCLPVMLKAMVCFFYDTCFLCWNQHFWPQHKTDCGSCLLRYAYLCLRDPPTCGPSPPYSRTPCVKTS